MVIKRFLGLIIALFGVLNIYAATPAETLSQASKQLSSAKGISANFQMNIDGKSYRGVYKAKGNRFSMVSNGLSVWYDGKNMWTYNHLAKETTLTVPTNAEVAESNPLSYIKNYASNYSVSAAKKISKGRKNLILTPKKGAKGYVPVEITLEEGSLKPLQIKITPKGMSASILNLTNVNYNAIISDSEFKYPASKYKGVEIVDMR